MESKNIPKNPHKRNHHVNDFDKDSVVNWNHLGKHLYDFWEDIYKDYIE